MKWGVIATWRMVYEGVSTAIELFNKNATAGDILETIIKAVEDYPYYKSVGYGGLPNENGEVELDAAFMNGDNLAIGAVAGIKDFKNPISIAKHLAEHERHNILLVSGGAEAYAHKNGFERKNMLTNRAKLMYHNKVAELSATKLKAYDGHDTVGTIVLDSQGSMAAGTSTSGLFMKKPGRVGDSPLSGSGFYVDSTVGGASATGLGEDIMKGCLSYEVVRQMAMLPNKPVQEIIDEVLFNFHQKLKTRFGEVGGISLIAMRNNGEWGVASNVEFSFVVANTNKQPAIYVANPNADFTKTNYDIATKEWLDNYEKRIKSPLK
ncbi:N(4)-(beta-N-acetylglucosaminyl)-L-asparaginase [Spiroplasma sp. DGKH1]|uniref:N(4)-(beta-N-acetylglucosaminyl)-L-asparaginase n=1 Tax=Spiroplasma sp. DGKH1 TaxID=3050074 RepID=UPI0034C5EE4F